MATPAEHKAAERLEERESVQFALDQARGDENRRLNAEPERAKFPKSNLR